MQKPIFVSTTNGVKNVSLSSSIIYDDGFTLALDPKCNAICFEKGDDSLALFERLKKVVKPTKGHSIILDNGSFIDPSVIAEIFISPKSSNLLITGTNGKLLYMFKTTDFSRLDFLLDELSKRMMVIGDGEPVTPIEWADFK
ncbi:MULTISPECIES: hypothetical protein [Vibrio]|uniref:hypothetical protein n=1 Tax=Vibrio TaxID=662 RepID=UPI0013024C6D|nr:MULTISPECIES: hypothetical protein [Vibrio]NAW77567.1 hypothetical protein [Vibrio sp. V33_P6A3T137]